VKDQLYIELSDTKANFSEMEIVNIQGKLMMTVPVSADTIAMNVSSLPAGHYFGVLKSNTSVVGRTRIFVIVK